MIDKILKYEIVLKFVSWSLSMAQGRFNGGIAGHIPMHMGQGKIFCLVPAVIDIIAMREVLSQG